MYLKGVLLCVLPLLTFVTSVVGEREPCPLHRATGVAESDKTGCYIIKLHGDTSSASFQSTLQKVTELSTGHRVYQAGQRVGKYITVQASENSLETIRRMPEVEYIEEETMAYGDQIPWHVDELDHIGTSTDSRFNPLTFGEGVDIYIFDSGINYDHEDFEYRAKFSDYDPTDTHYRTNYRGRDCNGHGSHVASLAAGRVYGVAKEAQMYSVRVLDCSNSAPWSVILDGLDYVAGVIESRGRPAVVSMSLSGSYTRSVNDAVQDVYNKGIPVVVSAGNNFGDACRRSPASSSYAITVGGSSQGGGLYSSTNYGQCVDIYAPGSSISGVDHTCNSCYKTISGTSMATPKVSGVIAILLSRQPLLTPAEVRNQLILLSGKNQLNFNSIPFQYRSRTPNRLLYVPGNCGGSFSASSPQVIRSPRNQPANVTVYPPNIRCKWTITAAAGRRVQLDFTSFFLERNYDVVRVCEGDRCGRGSVIASLSGELTATSRRYLSVGGVMTVEMVTDGRTQLQGFVATVSSTGTAQTPSPPTNVTTPTSPPTNGCITNLPVLFNDIIQDASVVIQKAVSDSLAGFLETRLVAGLEPQLPAQSCSHVAQSRTLRPDLSSGMYWVRSSNGTAVHVFCDLETTKCSCNRSPGWMKMVDLDMRDPSQNCPPGLKLWTSPVRSCGRVHNSPGCSSTFLSTNGISYSRVCGRVIGYQYSSPNAFYAHQYNPDITLDGYYVDGVSLTYGWSPRRHIWTFAAALSEVDTRYSICPCTNSDHTLPQTAVPEFIGNNYFCDTGSSTTYRSGRFYDNDPLWDGRGCGPKNSCCDNMGTGYFCTDLGETSTQDIELRVCGDSNTNNEDVPIEIVNIYVQ